MHLPWNDRRTRQFLTNIGLITSDGPWGPNVMAAEWTFHISYAPSLIAVCIHPWDATAENIAQSREFGVNLASEDQSIISSVAGGYTGKEVDKMAVLRELGVEFYDAKKIKVLMVKGAAMNVECRLFKQEELGDHVMFVGEVVEISADERIKPIIYHNGKYWSLGEHVPRPPEVFEKIEKLAEKYTKTR